MAPLRSHLFHLFHTLKTTDRKVSFWYGGRTRRELFYVEDFRAIEKEFPNFKFYISLDNPLPEDNWTVKEEINDDKGEGFKGYIMPCSLEICKLTLRSGETNNSNVSFHNNEFPNTLTSYSTQVFSFFTYITRITFDPTLCSIQFTYTCLQ